MKISALLTTLLTTCAYVFTMGLSSGATAERVAMPIYNQSSTIERPNRGISKSQVEAQFGAPESRHGPTGEPAIYYWEYPAFTVYFENDTVIHSVLKQKMNKTIK